MKPKKIHIVPVILFGLLALPLILTIALQLWQVHLQKEAEEKLEAGFLQTITVSSDELIWERKNKEANLKGKLFDVKSFSIKNGKYVLTGFFDEKETAVKNILQKQAGGFNDSLLQLLIVMQCFLTCIYYLFHFHLNFSFKRNYFFFRNDYCFTLKDIPSPPPKYRLVFI